MMVKCYFWITLFFMALDVSLCFCWEILSAIRIESARLGPAEDKVSTFIVSAVIVSAVRGFSVCGSFYNSEPGAL